MKPSALITILLVTGLSAADGYYDADPKHPWNRLQRELYTGVTPDGKPYFGEGINTPARARFFSDDPSSHRPVAEALDEFVAAGGESMVTDPLWRALMQRDLWAVFTATISRSSHPHPHNLHARLVRVMRAIALSPEEIDALPDNLALAAGAGAFPAEFDSERPNQPFLPANLMQPDGPWVLLENRRTEEQIAALVHLSQSRGRAAFLLFLRLPGGRESTEAYLAKLGDALAKRLQWDETPQFPLGTQAILLRRMMLVDSAGHLRLSPLTEILQIRVYRRLDLPDVFEFTLNREDLLTGRSGGLRPADVPLLNESQLKRLGLGVAAQPSENNENDGPHPLPEVKSCMVCHAAPGILGFQSVFSHHTSPLGPADLRQQVASTIEFTYATEAWKLLQDAWQKED